MTDELEAFSWENQTDEELLNGTTGSEPEPTPLELAAKMDSIFGPEPSMTLQPDPSRKIANPVGVAIKDGMSAFDMAEQFSVEDLTAFRDLHGGSGTDPVELNKWHRSDLAASIATRLATRATAPTPDEIEAALSPVSEALIDLSESDFESLVQDTLKGGGGFGLPPEVKKLRRMMKTQQEEF